MALYFPIELQEAARQGKIVLFVGAGLSMAAGYPSWRELITKLMEEAKQVPGSPIAGIAKLESADDYLKLAEFARNALGLSRYTTLLRGQFERRAEPTPSHRLIARTNYRGIVTTNFDRILETTITIERGWTPTTFNSENISAMAGALYDPQLFIYKLHGDIASPESIILTSQDYDRVILSSPHVRNFLQAIFLNYTIVFVGYSLNDPDFNLMLRELNLIFRGYTPAHFALMPDPPEFMINHLRSQNNIQIIPYSTAVDGHTAVTDYLQQISAIAPYPIPHAVAI